MNLLGKNTVFCGKCVILFQDNEQFIDFQISKSTRLAKAAVQTLLKVNWHEMITNEVNNFIAALNGDSS